MSADKLAQLFQPFNRLGQQFGSEDGVGIGLVVCKRLVEMMGGAIGAESAEGLGSVFWVDLNLTAPRQVAGRTMTGTAVGQGDALEYTLLYVEDNLANLMLVQSIISRQPSIQLLTAKTGQIGIEMARKFQPDIVLMDINLPDMSGIEAMRILLQDPVTAHLRFIALSASAMPADVEKGLLAGFTRYLTKPIKIDELMRALETNIKLARGL